MSENEVQLYAKKKCICSFGKYTFDRLKIDLPPGRPSRITIRAVDVHHAHGPSEGFCSLMGVFSASATVRAVAA